MKKNVIFEFPDDFEFPEKFSEYGGCKNCPFFQMHDWDEWCFLTGDGDDTKGEERKHCPFYGGADTVNFDEY